MSKNRQIRAWVRDTTLRTPRVLAQASRVTRSEADARAADTEERPLLGRDFTSVIPTRWIGGRRARRGPRGKNVLFLRSGAQNGCFKERKEPRLGRRSRCAYPCCVCPQQSSFPARLHFWPRADDMGYPANVIHEQDGDERTCVVQVLYFTAEIRRCHLPLVVQ